MNDIYVGILTRRLIKDTNECITNETIAVIVFTRLLNKLSIISPSLITIVQDQTQDKR